MTWTIRVDQKACIGNKMCTANAPGAFVVEDGKSRPVTEQVEPSPEIVAAWEMCPGSAILLFDESGEEVFPS